MVSIGVFSDSDGDLAAFDAALRLLSQRGARRFLFAGGRYEDLDLWVRQKQEQVKAKSDYSDLDFLCDIENYLVGREQIERPPAFGEVHEQARVLEELSRLKDRLLRTPERGSEAYQDPLIPKKMLEMLDDTLCCLVYDRNDLSKEDLINASVLVHGKEATPQVVQIGPCTFVAPGRLSGPNPTVGLLESSGKQLVFSAFTLSGEMVIDRKPIAAASGKMKLAVK